MEYTEPPNHATWLRHTGDEPHLLREVMRTHQAVMHAFTREVGMPSARLALMRLLATCDTGELGIMEIAKRLGVNAAAVTRQVQDMEVAGLISRGADRLDKRRCPIRLTDGGRVAFEHMHQRAHDFERHLAALVKPEDIATTIRVLGQVRAALDVLAETGSRGEPRR